MKVNDELVDHLAHLSILQFDGEARDSIKTDMENMLAFVDKLNEIDTEGLEPLTYVNEEADVLRKDKVTSTITQKEALKNAPKADSDYFKVPRVLEK